MFSHNHKKGFTLIELMVVISVISLLSNIVLSSVNSARAKARDTERKTTLRQLAIANESLFNDTGAYAISAGWLTTWVPNSNAIAPTYISKVSPDPGGNGSVGYQYWRKDFSVFCPPHSLGEQKYGFYARLENPSAADLATISDSFDLCIQNYYGMQMNYRVGN